MLSRTQPGAICPTCKQPLPADAVAQAQDDLRQKLGEVASRGQGLRSQLNDLTAQEKQAQEEYGRFGRIYRSGGVLTGLMLIILLILCFQTMLWNISKMKTASYPSF